MLFLISLAIALITAFLLDKPLKRHPVIFYVTAAVLTVFSIAAVQSGAALNSLVKDYILAVFTRGALGAAFWVVVMWAGALPNGLAAIKKLMPIRGELSITAAILTLSHIVTFGIEYISDLTRGRTGSDFWTTSFISLAMVLIMLPLTVMSFKAVRRRMNAKTWKKIQRAAYIFYGLIFIHILVLLVPRAQKGRDGCFLSVLAYSAVFIGYAVMRIRKAYIARNRQSARTAPNAVCACAMIVPLCIIGFISRNTDSRETITATKEAPATFKFEAPTSQTTLPITTVSVSSTVSAVSATTSTSAEPVSASTSETTIAAETSSSTAAAESVTETVTTPTAATEITTTQPVTTTTVTEPVYRCKNGTFEGTGEGYSGTVHVSITIENDYITAFSAYAEDDDPDYFSDAMQYVIPQIQRSLNTDVDACSGATYSSKGIMEAAKNALEKAMN